MAINFKITTKSKEKPATTTAAPAPTQAPAPAPTAAPSQPGGSTATTPQAPATMPVSDVSKTAAQPAAQAAPAQQAPAPAQPAPAATQPAQPVQPAPAAPATKQVDVSKMNDRQKSEYYMSQYMKGTNEPRQIPLQQLKDAANNIPKAQYAEAPKQLDYAAILDKIAPVPETPEEEKRRKKRARANAVLAALGDGIASIANLVATSRYAPNAYDGTNTLSERAKLRYEKNKDKIEALQKERRMAEYQMTKAKYDDDWKRADYDNTLAARKRADAVQDYSILGQNYDRETAERNARETKFATMGKWHEDQYRYNQNLEEQRKARRNALALARQRAVAASSKSKNNKEGADVILGTGKYQTKIPSTAFYDNTYMVGLFRNMATKIDKMPNRGLKQLYNAYRTKMNAASGGSDGYDLQIKGEGGRGGRTPSLYEQAELARNFFDTAFATHTREVSSNGRASNGTYSPADLTHLSQGINNYIYSHGTPYVE